MYYQPDDPPPSEVNYEWSLTVMYYQPDFGRNADHRKEMSINVEVSEEAFDSHAIDSE